MTDIQVFDGDGTKGMLVFSVVCESWVETKGQAGRKIDFWWTSVDPAERNVYLRTLRSAVGCDVRLNIRWPEGIDDERYAATATVDINVVEVAEAVRQTGQAFPQYGLVLHAQKQWWPT